MITKKQLSVVLDAWEVARERTLQEHRAMNDLIQSQKSFILSMRELGHTWSQAEDDFVALQESHRIALLDAYKALDERIREYRNLSQKHKIEK